MAKYIECEAFIKKLSDKSINPATTFINTVLKGLFEEAPAADVIEVKHGKWLKTDAYPHRVYCSLCFKTYVTNEEAIQGRDWQHPVYCTEAEYCPHCGAKMDGIDNGREE